MQERLKGLRAERGLTLERLAEQTHFSKSALGSYEADDFKDISHLCSYQAGKVLRRDRRGNRQREQRPGASVYGVYLQASQAELQEAVRRGKEVVEKSKPTEGEKMRN